MRDPDIELTHAFIEATDGALNKIKRFGHPAPHGADAILSFITGSRIVDAYRKRQWMQKEAIIIELDNGSKLTIETDANTINLWGRVQ